MLFFCQLHRRRPQRLPFHFPIVHSPDVSIRMCHNAPAATIADLAPALPDRDRQPPAMAVVAVVQQPTDELLASSTDAILSAQAPKGKANPIDNPDTDRPTLLTKPPPILNASHPLSASNPPVPHPASPSNKSQQNSPPNPPPNPPTPKPQPLPNPNQDTDLSSHSIDTSRTTTASAASKPVKSKGKSSSCVCEGCSEPHDGSYGSGRFCSVHCARRIAASRKWEKQRSERKRLAVAAAAAAASAPLVDQSTSSLSSASSLEGRGALKRRRVVMMSQTGYHNVSAPPPVPHTHHQPHYTHLVQPQPQHFARHHTLPQPHPMLTHMSAARPPLASTPPLGATPPPYIDYSHIPVRTVSPFYTSSPPAYYPYHAPVAYTPPPQYPMYASQQMQGMPHPQMPPPPPPPTPAPDSLHDLNGAQFVNGQAQGAPGGAMPYPHAPQTQVSGERECAAIAEALLCLRKSNNNE